MTDLNMNTKNTIFNKLNFLSLYCKQELDYSDAYGDIIKLIPLSLLKDEDKVAITELALGNDIHMGTTDTYIDCNSFSFVVIDHPSIVTEYVIDLSDVNCEFTIRNLSKTPNRQINMRNASEVEYYLRSKNYALPFVGLSVEQMVDFGWFRLDHSCESKELVEPTFPKDRIEKGKQYTKIDAIDQQLDDEEILSMIKNSNLITLLNLMCGKELNKDKYKVCKKLLKWKYQKRKML